MLSPEDIEMSLRNGSDNTLLIPGQTKKSESASAIMADTSQILDQSEEDTKQLKQSLSNFDTSLNEIQEGKSGKKNTLKGIVSGQWEPHADKKAQTAQKIMRAIQMGIQHAIGGLASKPERDILIQDFMTVEQMDFPSAGSDSTLAHQFSQFRFKTYAPTAFRHFRDLFGIKPDDFLGSLCSESLRNLSNPGASGSIFYVSHDDEFIMKTVESKECEFLKELLLGYYINLRQNPRTLLPKFFGLFNYTCIVRNVRLVVMNNIFPSSIKIHEKYDLKGSTYQRKASKTEREKGSPTYKDLDFLDKHPDGLILQPDTYAALVKTLQRDIRVLESFDIMDYSLLLGIHNLDQAARENVLESQTTKTSFIVESNSDAMSDNENERELHSRKSNRRKIIAHSTMLESIEVLSGLDTDDDGILGLGGIPARNADGERLLLFLGVIDILQSYRLRKKLEHGIKAIIHDGSTVSVTSPKFYAERFMKFMTKSVFKIHSPYRKELPSKKWSGMSAAIPSFFGSCCS